MPTEEAAPAEMIKLSVDAHGIATLLLNRPDRLNAFTVAMIRQWEAALAKAAADPAVKVVVLTGAGRAFCAGGDVEDFSEVGQGDAMARKNYLWTCIHNIVSILERLDKPVIAAINGPARGAGLDMALMCDLRLAARSATLAESYISMGLIAGDAGTWFLPRLIGTARALELFWTGEAISAEEAHRIGMVNRIVADDQLMDATYGLARRIASQAPEAVKFFKRAVHQGLEMPLRAHLDMVSSHMSVLMETADHKQRAQAFLKRKT